VDREKVGESILSDFGLAHDGVLWLLWQASVLSFGGLGAWQLSVPKGEAA
jgi:hypothetical protein